VCRTRLRQEIDKYRKNQARRMARKKYTKQKEGIFDDESAESGVRPLDVNRKRLIPRCRDADAVHVASSVIPVSLHSWSLHRGPEKIMLKQCRGQPQLSDV